jgi:hypothetical protein
MAALRESCTKVPANAAAAENGPHSDIRFDSVTPGHGVAFQSSRQNIFWRLIGKD